MAAIDTTPLQAELTRLDTLEGSIEALLAGQAAAHSAAVAKAISDTQLADAATLAQITTAAQTAIDDATAGFKLDNDKLTAAVAAGTPAATV